MDIFGIVLLIGFSAGVALWMLNRVKKIWYQYQVYQMMQGDQNSELMDQMKSQLQQQGENEETEEETKSKTKGMYQ